ncbi:alpha/beta hydrolase family protein [Roseateles aquae]
MRWLAGGLALLLAAPAWAGLGFTTLAATEQDGPVSVYYPSAAGESAEAAAPLGLMLAFDAPPQRGNGRLVMISHGSGGSPWVHAGLARALVDAGFVVAMPEHRDDNYRHGSRPGPDSWKLRPAEVTRAIDAIGRDARFAPLLQLDKVGVFGMSAGGHTALVLAGGRWSPSRFRDQCLAHLGEDFQSCVGLITSLKGNGLDGLKQWLARRILSWRFDDETLHGHTDPRIAAVVAAVPSAAHFEMSSFEQLAAPLALMTARQDAWLHPQFHSDRVLAACPRCELLAELKTGGHGAYLSPLPPGLSGLIGAMINDPPGFDRSTEVPAVNRKVLAYFDRLLRNN